MEWIEPQYLKELDPTYANAVMLLVKGKMY